MLHTVWNVLRFTKLSTIKPHRKIGIKIKKNHLKITKMKFPDKKKFFLEKNDSKNNKNEFPAKKNKN
jgi:hypothetical protein